MKHRLEYALVAAMIAIVRWMPPSAVEACGTALGLMAYRLDGSHRRTAELNLAAAFPSRSGAERQAIVRAAFVHFGHLLLQLLKFSTLTPEQVLERAEVQGEEHIRGAYARGHGILLVSGHFGFWEIHGIVHALRYEPIGVMARPLDNPYLHALLERIRQRTGNTVIYRQGGLRRVLRMIKEGHAVAALIDQHIHGPDAVYVDFFDRPAATTSAIAALALRTGAEVIPTFTVPLGRGRYRMIYEPPVPVPPADSPNAVRELTQRCTEVLESYVRQHPQLWLWMHRRWREPHRQDGLVPATVGAGEAHVEAARE